MLAKQAASLNDLCSVDPFFRATLETLGFEFYERNSPVFEYVFRINGELKILASSGDLDYPWWLR